MSRAIENLTKISLCISSCKTLAQLDTSKKMLEMHSNYIEAKYINKIPLILSHSIKSMRIQVKHKRVELGYSSRDPFEEMHFEYLQRQSNGIPDWINSSPRNQPTVTES